MTTPRPRAAPVLDPRVAHPANPDRRGEPRRLQLLEPVPESGEPSRRRQPCRTQRVLHPKALASLEQYRSTGGLHGLEVASAIAPEAIVATILESGLRGRGGAGFPTGRKWQTVAANAMGGPRPPSS